MRRLIPATQTLIVFEAAARHQSFSRAAEELHCTQSAIYRQIIGLEELLCVSLFHRSKRRVTLTDAGYQYWKKIQIYLNHLEEDSYKLMSFCGKQQSLELAVFPTFATLWLIPRLPDFYQLYPHITINLHVKNDPFLFKEYPLDAAIHFGEGIWPDAECEYFMGETIVPVGSPVLLKTIDEDFEQCPDKLTEFPLLQHSGRPDEWANWFHQMKVIAPLAKMGQRMELFSMVIEAAKAGLGLALAPYHFIERNLAEGSLVIPVSARFQSNKNYYVVYPYDKSSVAALMAFKTWIKNQALIHKAS